MDRQNRFQEGIERYRNAIADYPEDAIPFRIEQKRGDSPRVLRVFSPEGGKSLPLVRKPPDSGTSTNPLFCSRCASIGLQPNRQ